MKLRTKFIVPITGAVFISISITVATLYFNAREILEQGILNDLSSRVTTLTENIDNWLTGCKKDVETFTELTSVINLLKSPHTAGKDEEVNVELTRIVKNYPVFTSINILSLDGEVLASTVPRKGKRDRVADGKKPVNLTMREYYQKGLKGTFSITNAMIGKTSGKPVFIIAGPVFDKERTIGVVYAVVRLQRFTENFIDKVKIGKTGYAYLMNSKGLVIAHPHKEFILKENLAEKHNFAKEMIQKKTGIKSYNWEGLDKIFAYKQSEMKGWIVAAGVSKDEIYTPVIAMRNIGLGILITASIITFFLIFILIRWVVKGITVITAASDELARGNTEYSFNFTSNDEIGHMADSFRTMSKNLQEKSNIAEDISDGDLRIEVPIASKDDTLGKALQKMIDKTSYVLGNIQNASERVDIGSQQVSSLSDTLSSAAQESAASIEEISSSLTEIQAQSRQNAETSHEALKVSDKAKKHVVEGTDRMSSLGEAMDKISKSSEQIGKIIKVIDDIAFQTNLLALNAAVEAARAGVHGKGFAVVAEEVRSLAGRSAKAANETSQLIEGAISDVTSGYQMTQSTIEIFETIEGSVQDISGLVEQISSATGEESVGLRQITEAFEQIDAVTQMNSANSEETAASSRELSSLATQLKQSLALFKMKEEETDTTPPIAQLPKGI